MADRVNLYSKAAQIARSLPQNKGTVDQMLAMLRKAGVKPAELEHAGRPDGDTIDREALAKHFEDRMPGLSVERLGVEPMPRPKEPEHITNARRRMTELDQIEQGRRARGEAFDRPTTVDHGGEWGPEPIVYGHSEFRSPEEHNEYQDLYRQVRHFDRPRMRDDLPESKYDQYTMPGGKNYREHLITYPTSAPPELDAQIVAAAREANRLRVATSGPNATTQDWDNYYDASARHDELLRQQEEHERQNAYKSSHWAQPNVLAHVRMHDRTGPNGERVLHVEEIQSDWAQDARKKGIAEQPDMERHGSLLPAYDAAMRAQYNASRAYREHLKSEPEFFDSDEQQKAFVQREKELYEEKHKHLAEMERLGKMLDEARAGKPGVPNAPYIGNTNQWTDLALKHALSEAAKGGYDKLAITPGQVQSERYGMGAHGISSLAYDPDTKELGYYRDGKGWTNVSEEVEPENVGDYIGQELSERLLSTDRHPLSGVHLLEGEDMKVSNKGMVGYYDKIVPGRIKALTGQDMKPYDLDNQTRLHSIDIDDNLRDTAAKGFPAFRRGGIVEDALKRIRGNDR